MIKQKFCVSEYIPIRYPVSESQADVREKIWSFKDGFFEGQEYFLDKVIFGVNQIKSLNPGKRIIIIPIPASTYLKTHSRFFNFLERVCSNTNIINGFNCVTAPDHEPAHCGGTRNHIFYKNTTRISEDDILIIFDDIITTGTSFNNVSLLFPNNIIYGLFLGKTVHKD